MEAALCFMLNWLNWFRDSRALMTDSGAQGNRGTPLFLSLLVLSQSHGSEIQEKILTKSIAQTTI